MCIWFTFVQCSDYTKFIDDASKMVTIVCLRLSGDDKVDHIQDGTVGAKRREQRT